MSLQVLIPAIPKITVDGMLDQPPLHLLKELPMGLRSSGNRNRQTIGHGA